MTDITEINDDGNKNNLCNEAALSRDRARRLRQDFEDPNSPEARRRQLERFGIRVHGANEAALDAAERAFFLRCLARNEVGDAELFVFLNMNRFMAVLPSERWYVWSGHAWAEDRLQRHRVGVEDVAAIYQNLAFELSRELAAPGLDDVERKRLLRDRRALERRALALRTRRRSASVLNLSLASAFPGLTVDEEDLDQRPGILPVANGIIDLSTGRLHPGHPEDRITRPIGVEWRGLDEPAPLWLQTLNEIFDEDQSLIGFLARSLGHALLGRPAERKLFVWRGRGSNGKSLLERILIDLLSPHAISLKPEVLLASRGNDPNAPNPDIFRLKDARLAFAPEPARQRWLASDVVKRLTGRDRLVARRPYGDLNEFVPQHVLFLLANDLPNVDGNDQAIWDRIVVLPFPVTFAPEQEIPAKEAEGLRVKPIDLYRDEALKQEYPGILAWLVRGCLEWQAKGLCLPDRVTEQTEAIRRENDVLGEFFNDALERGGENDRVSSSALFERFREWHAEMIGKEVSFGPRKFSNEMLRRFSWLRKTKASRIFFVGLRLKNDF